MTERKRHNHTYTHNNRPFIEISVKVKRVHKVDISNGYKAIIKTHGIVYFDFVHIIKLKLFINWKSIFG